MRGSTSHSTSSMYQTTFLTSSPTLGFSCRTSSVCQSVAIWARIVGCGVVFLGCGELASVELLERVRDAIELLEHRAAGCFAGVRREREGDLECLNGLACFLGGHAGLVLPRAV